MEDNRTLFQDRIGKWELAQSGEAPAASFNDRFSAATSRASAAAAPSQQDGWLSPTLPKSLTADGQVLCFDGVVEDDLDVSPARNLRDNGLFVVRSPGGSSRSAMVLSEIVGERHATVVVHDYCFSACSMLFLIASYQSYVLRGTPVTWHYPRSADPTHPGCTFLTEPADGGPKKLQRGPCQNGGELGVRLWPELARFFEKRAINPSFDPPPESLHVRRIVTNLYAETGVFRDIAWTVHPRYYPVLFKTKIFYEAYPKSQEEVDGMSARLGLTGKLIYDP
jgi:hypothetical protein